MWDQVEAREGVTVEWTFPLAAIRARLDGGIWQTHGELLPAASRATGIRAAKTGHRDDRQWLATVAAPSRWIRAVPGLPDRPYAAEFRGTLRIAPGARAATSLLLPLEASIELDDGTSIGRYPLRPQSTTWFGTRDSGVHCYTLPAMLVGATRLSRLVERPDPSIALCSIELENTTGATIDVSTLQVPVEWLSIWKSGDLVATDGLEYQWSEREGLSIKVGREPDAAAFVADKVSGPRKSERRGFFDRGFALLYQDKGGAR